jgi:isocitrate lyase
MARGMGKALGLSGKAPGPVAPHTAGSELRELNVRDEGSPEKLANIIFANVQDRRGRSILSVRDQNTLPALRRKRLMALVRLFLIHRYGSSSVHYVSPTEDNERQTEKMKSMGIFSDVHTEVGQIIVAQVDKGCVAELLKPDRAVLMEMIRKTSPQMVQARARRAVLPRFRRLPQRPLARRLRADQACA